MDNYNLDTFDKDCDDAKQSSKDNNSEILTEEEFFEFIKEDNTDILLESINEQDVKSIFKETPFSVENIEKLERFIRSVNQEESSNINPNNIPSKEDVLQILKDMRTFNMFELYTFLRKKDKSDDANKGNSNKILVSKGILSLVQRYKEKHSNEKGKILVLNILDNFFYKDKIKNFAKETGISEDIVKKCLKQNAKGYYLGERTIEKACQKLGIN